MKTKLLIIFLLISLFFVTGCTDVMFKNECGNDDNFLMSISTSYHCVDKHTMAFCKLGNYYETYCEDGCSDNTCGCDKSTFDPSCTENGDSLTCTEQGAIYPEKCSKGCLDGACLDECPIGTTWGRGENRKFACLKSANECDDPTFDSQCVAKNKMLKCEDGEPSIEECEYGCFEAICRGEEGPTDREEECLDRSDCETNEICEYGNCVNENKCNYNSDCDTGYSCEEYECVKDVECNYNSDCDTGYSCLEEECVEDLECEYDYDCESNEFCEANKCIIGCEDDYDCDEGTSCQLNKCTKSETCIDDWDCEINFECKKDVCVAIPECTKGTVFCGSSTQLITCEDEKIKPQICEFGCKDNKCLTEKQKQKLEEELEEKESCKENHKTCVSDSKLEFCLDEKITTEFCEFGCEKNKCLAEKECPWYNPTCWGKSKVLDYKDAVSEKYLGGLDKEISKETDPAKIRGLKKYKEFLEKAGNGIESAQTTYEDLMTMKKIFIDSYDPSRDIEHMKARDILKKGFTDKLGDSLDKLKFWKGKKTPVMLEQEKAEDQLRVYKAMLERQEENDFLKSSRKDRLVNTLISKTKDKAVSELTEKATEIAEDIAGPAFITVGIAGQAIDAVKDESEKMMYTGLIKAYNKRREAFERDYPDKSDEELHEMTTNEVIEYPYQDDPKFTRLASYGNLVLQRECGESNSKLCIDRKVFFTAMEESYNHLNKKKLFDRRMEQLDKRLNK